jgi:hypothetical protein
MSDQDRGDAGLSDLTPREPIHRLTGPIGRFLHIQAASGMVLLVGSVAALVLANTPWAEPFLATWATKVGFAFGGFEMNHSLRHWINDGLMVIFFFVVGLEVKRELALGELRDPKRAALPLAAAFGGMIVPPPSTSRSRPASRRPEAGASPWPRTSRSWSAAWRCWGRVCPGACA